MRSRFLQHLWRTQRHGRYTILLILLAMVFGLLPCLPLTLQRTWVRDMLFTAMLLSCVFAVGRQRRILPFAILLGVGMLVTSWLTYAVVTTGLVVASYLLSAAFFSCTTVIMLLDVVSSRRVTSHTISGAVCVYVMVGLVWAFVFTAVDYMDPDAFVVAPVEEALAAAEEEGLTRPGRMNEMGYFSFVTLTGLGYGDTVPKSRVARSFAQFEAIVGQLFLAVLIARLVSIHTAQSIHEELESQERDARDRPS